MSKVAKTKDCWLWTGSKNNNGYGNFGFKDSEGLGKSKAAHRVVYELLVGEIPKGLQLDHLCKNTSCVNPDHLEPVTSRENWARASSPSRLNALKEECHRGHPFDRVLMSGARAGKRICNTCASMAAERYKATRFLT